jgi:peptide/nickel transport system permease protein
MPEPLLISPVATDSELVTGTSAGPSRSRRRSTVRRFARNRLAMTSAILLLFMFAAGVIGPHFTPYGFADLTGDYSQPPSAKHWMGTDAIGHDLLSQVLRASQKSIQIALVVAALSTFIGVVVGTVAGYYRGWVDTLLSRLTDLVLVVPVLAVLLAAANSISRRGGNWFLVALLIAVFLWPTVALVVRSTVLSLREQDFVQAQVAIGAGDVRIIVKHLIPNAVGPIAVSATLLVVTAILLESSLAFLGFGIAPPDTSLGKLVAIGQAASSSRPWLFYFPGLVLLVICLCVNFIGDGLRDAFDTKRSGDRA